MIGWPENRPTSPQRTCGVGHDQFRRKSPNLVGFGGKARVRFKLGTLKPHFRPVHPISWLRERLLKCRLSRAKRVLRAPAATQGALVSAMSKWPIRLDIAPRPSRARRNRGNADFQRVFPG